MADSGLVIPSELGRIVSERATLWQRFDASQSQIGEIEKLAHEVSSSTPAEIPSELTGDKTPVAEVAAALQGLQSELAEISKAQASIQTHEAEILRLKAERQKILMIAVIVIVIIVLVVLYSVQSGF